MKSLLEIFSSFTPVLEKNFKHRLTICLDKIELYVLYTHPSVPEAPYKEGFPRIEIITKLKLQILENYIINYLIRTFQKVHNGELNLCLKVIFKYHTYSSEALLTLYGMLT